MGASITVEEIKSIRRKYGLTQQSFARLLGIGEASMVRYENGQEPSKANANLIRAAAHPDFMAECLERDGDLLSSAQRESVEQVVYSMVTFNEKGEVMDINELYMLTLEQEILNEKAARVLADAMRLYSKAAREGDEVGMILYDDIMTLVAKAKGSIIHQENDSFEKVAEIRGCIEGLDSVLKCQLRKAA